MRSVLWPHAGQSRGFRACGLAYSRLMSNVKVSVEKRSGGEPYVQLTSTQPVHEPFVDLLVELTWSSGRISREFTALLDPPSVIAEREKQKAAAAEVRAAPTQPQPAGRTGAGAGRRPTAKPLRQSRGQPQRSTDCPPKRLLPNRRPQNPSAGEPAAPDSSGTSASGRNHWRHPADPAQPEAIRAVEHGGCSRG